MPSWPWITPARSRRAIAREARAFARVWAVAAALVAVMAAMPTTATAALNFSSGASAGLVLGAPSMTSAGIGTRMGSSLHKPFGISIDPATGKIFVGDLFSHRVGIYNSFPASSTAAFDVLVGTASRTSSEPGCSGTTTRSPRTAFGGAGKFGIADTENNRVLLYNSVPTADGATPDLVLGQPDLITCTAGGGASKLNHPNEMWTDGTRIVVGDSHNNRMLIWKSWPTTNGAPADVVLGQPDMTSISANRGGAAGQNTLRAVRGLWSNGSKLIAADTDNHRVLFWDTFPTCSPSPCEGPMPTRVLGQTDWSDAYVCGSNRFLYPIGVSSNGAGKVLVNDPIAHKIYLWDNFTSTFGTNADHVLGQVNIGNCTNTARNAGSNTVSASTLSTPEYAWTDGTQIVTTDRENHRILKWNSWPTNAPGTAPKPADLVLAQPNMSSAGPYGKSLANHVWRPYLPWSRDQWVGGGSWIAVNPRGGLLISGSSDNSVTQHYENPVVDNEPADSSFGHASFASDTSCDGPSDHGGNTSATSLCRPAGVWTDGTKLLVADTENNRVKVWNTYPTSLAQAPDLVLGQAGFTSDAAATSQTGLDAPVGVASDGTRVVVTEFDNHRVLIWNTWPTSSGQAASLVLGQPNFTSNTANNGGISASSLNRPNGVWLDAGRLALADQYNHRILIWNTFPTTSNQAASAVYGQSGFTSSSTTSISYPKQVAISKGVLVFTAGCRAQYVDPLPTTAQATGAVDVSGTTCSTTRSATSIYAPTGLGAWNGNVWLADSGHGRVLAFGDVTPPAITAGPTVSVSCSTVVVTWTTDEASTSELHYGTTPQTKPRLYSSRSVDTGLVTSHSRTLTGLAAGTYYFRVQSKDALNNPRFSSEGTFTIGAPHVIDNVAAGGDATWRTTNSGSYDVDFCAVSPSSLASWSTAVHTDPLLAGTQLQTWTQQGTLTGTSYTTNWPLVSSTWTALQEGTNYVSVRVADSAARTGQATDAFVVKKDTVPPPAVTSLSATSPTTTSPALTWTTVADVTSGTGYYRVYRSTSSGTLGTQINVNGGTTSGSYTDTTALAGTKYYYTVRAVDVAGLENTTASNAQVGVNVAGTLVLTLDSTSKTMSPTIEADTTATTTVTVDTDSGAGYTLTATDASDTWGMEQAAVDTLSDWTGTNATPTNWAAGTSGYFGLTVLCVNSGSPCTAAGSKDAGRWGTGYGQTDYASLNYAGLRTSSTTLHTTSADIASTQTIVTSYRANFSTNELAGTYTTSIAYTVVANP